MEHHQRRNNIIRIINIILIIGIITFLYWLISRRQAANSGILTKAKVIKLVNLPKNGMSVHVIFKINNLEYKGYPNVSISLKNKIYGVDSIYIKYDLKDYSNVAIVTDSLN